MMNKGFPIPLSVDGLMAKAREISGIDIVDHDVVEPLTVLHRSLCEESQLHEKGAIARQNKLLTLLANRLRMQRDLAAHPEIAEEKIAAVLFTYGLPRTGTTKTQKVLAATGDFNWMPYWQGYNPSLITGSRDESPQARIAAADVYCRWFDEMSPITKYAHPFETHEPEEDTLLVEHCFRSSSPFGFSEVPSYMQWLATQGPLPMFHFLRDTMKYLQWQGLASGTKPWLLKAPVYFGMEPQLREVFPHAHLLMTHRAPVQTLPSVLKAIQSFHTPFTNLWPDPKSLCAQFAAQINHHLSVRKTHDELHILDLHFDEINKDMPAALEKIYSHAGMRLTGPARQQVRKWEADNPPHKKGAYRYSLEEFGLTEAQINRDMAAYLDFLKTKFGS